MPALDQGTSSHQVRLIVADFHRSGTARPGIESAPDIARLAQQKAKERFDAAGTDKDRDGFLGREEYVSHNRWKKDGAQDAFEHLVHNRERTAKAFSGNGFHPAWQHFVTPAKHSPPCIFTGPELLDLCQGEQLPPLARMAANSRFRASAFPLLAIPPGMGKGERPFLRLRTDEASHVPRTKPSFQQSFQHQQPFRENGSQGVLHA